MVWKNTTHGLLTLKEAYMFNTPGGQNAHWSKLVWNQDIPPTKSLLTWRLMHQRIPTDNNLMLRGCSLASICSNCSQTAETSFHLFFECEFAKYLWNCLAGILNISFHMTTMIYGNYARGIGPLSVKWSSKLALSTSFLLFGLGGTKPDSKTSASTGKSSSTTSSHLFISLAVTHLKPPLQI